MPDRGTQPGALLSIGYGDRSWDRFVDLLRRHGVEMLADVRSRPRSRRAEFNADSLRTALPGSGIEYAEMGDALGGMPSDPACRVNGRVDYALCERRPAFREELDRLIAQAERGSRVAVMCCELDPERCHRSMLIGEALRRRGVPLHHIERDGATASQETVIGRVTGGQAALFEDGPTPGAG